MKVNLLISITMLMTCLLSLCLMSGCAQKNTGNIPSLAGHSPNTSALPPPNDYQANSAINASTMLTPN